MNPSLKSINSYATRFKRGLLNLRSGCHLKRKAILVPIDLTLITSIAIIILVSTISATTPITTVTPNICITTVADQEGFQYAVVKHKCQKTGIFIKFWSRIYSPRDK